MSLWLLLDCLCLKVPNIIPTFFLLGLVTDKKISWPSIVSAYILFDWILFHTKYQFLIILLILLMLKRAFFQKNKNPYLSFTVYYSTFLLYLTLINQNTFTKLFQINFACSFFYSILLLTFCIKKHSNT